LFAEAWNSTKQLGHWMRIAIGLWVAFTIAAEVKAWKHPDQHAVYPVFAEGARHWLNDEPLYGQFFFYSPAFATAICPLAALPDRVGGVIWGTFNLAIVFAALAVFCREVVQKVRPEIRTGPFLALCLASTAHGCWSGQANALVLALVLFATVAGLRGKWWTAALLLAGGTHIKIWVAAVPALLALRWFRPLIPRFAAAFVLVGLLPLLMKSPVHVLATYQQWFACLSERMATGQRWPGYRDAWTIWENLAPPVSRQVFSALSLVAGLLTAVWCYGQLHAKNEREKGRGGERETYDISLSLPLPFSPACAPHFVLSVVSAWACWQLLFGPGAERLTYGIIAPAVSWAVCESHLTKRHRALAIAAWLLTGILGTGEIESRIQSVVPIAQIMTPLGAVLMVVWLLYRPSQTAQVCNSRVEMGEWSTTCSRACTTAAE
jgi:hypothetical protein